MKILLCVLAIVAFAGTAAAGSVDPDPGNWDNVSRGIEADMQRYTADQQRSDAEYQQQQYQQETQWQIDQARTRIDDLNRQIQDLRDNE